MLNIDTRLLAELEQNEFWVLMHITKRLGEEDHAWPSKRTLLKDCKWKSEKTLNAALDGLVQKCIIEISFRKREDGSQTSNMYTLISDLVGIYVPGSKMQKAKNDSGGVQKIQGGRVQKMQPPQGKKIQGVGSKKDTPNEVLTIEALNNEVLKNEYPSYAENEFSAGEKIGEAAREFETYGEPEPISKEKKKTPPSSASTPPRPANIEYQMLEAYAVFMEQKGIPVSRNEKGHVQFDKRVFKSCKDWAVWASGMPNATDTLNDWQQFLEAAWATGDKWLLANFEPNILYSKRTNIVAAIGSKQAKAKELMKSDGFIENLLGW